MIWNGSLPPGHRRDAAGRLHVGNVRADALATVYGTPLTVINVATVQQSIDRLHAVCDPLGINISYAAKAFVCTEFARFLSSNNVGLDVGSLGELEVAERGGYAAERLTMHGAGKTDSELRAALDGRVGRVILDGLSDLRRLASMAWNGTRVSIALRLNTGVDVNTHPHVRTVGDETKFGFVQDEEPAAVEIICANPALTFVGLHAHAGSQITDQSVLVENLSALVKASHRFSARGLTSRTLIAGGGFGIQADPQRPQDELDIGTTIAACNDFISADGSFRSSAIEFEPGRSIVGHAGSTIYEILAVKRRRDGNIVVVDGGMADNPRPMLYGAYHHIIPAVETGGPRCVTSVFGRACESDFIAEIELPDAIDRGDLLLVCTTGAYTYSMSSHYNGFPKPAVVGVLEGEHAPWIAAIR
jgi:diaminopimelate decarboxylase